MLHTKLAIASIGWILALALYYSQRLPWTQGAAAPEPKNISGCGVMKLSEAAKSWLEYHRAHSQKKNTVQSYLAMAKRLLRHFGDRDLKSISTEDIQGFLTQYTAGCTNHTK
jgi:hypothetical protein